MPWASKEGVMSREQAAILLCLMYAYELVVCFVLLGCNGMINGSVTLDVARFQAMINASVCMEVTRL